MFSEHLFTHKYDIDDLIAALCASQNQWLNTQTGAFSVAEPTVPATHRFVVEPLPASFARSLATSPEAITLSAEEQAQLKQAMAALTGITQLPAQFENGRLGGWLRERVKDAALDWLDGNNLIPPSMRHINRAKAAKLYNSRTVTIIETE
jgi:hypothetical protein